MKYSVIIPTLLLSFYCPSLRAQWRIVGSFPGAAVTSIYFLDDEGNSNIGFAGFAGGGIARTTDRGKTWVGSSTASIQGSVTDFAFKDSLTGWVAGPGGLIKTTDAGKTWQSGNLPVEIHALYYNKKKSLLFADIPYVLSKASSNDGATWYNNGAKMLLGFAFTNDTIGIRSTFDTLFEYTTDGGFTWNESNFGIECWQPVQVGKNKTFLAASETFIGSDKIYRTINGGLTWNPIFDFGVAGRLSGTIRGWDTLFAVQTDQSVCISTNEGESWISICGPGNGWDTRFYLHGDTIFAGDIYGNIWMTPNAHLGPDYNPVGVSDTVLRFYTSACSKATSGLTLFDISNCHKNRVQVLQLNITNGNNRFFIDRPNPLPKMFEDNEPINIAYYPAANQYDTAALYIQYQQDNTILDTTVTLFGQRIPSTAFSLNISGINSILPGPCTFIDTTITIKNAPCDSMSITSATLQRSNGAIILDSVFPVKLAPDSSYSIHLFYQPTEQGSYRDMLVVTLVVGDSQSVVNIPILIDTKKDVSSLQQILPGILNFGTVSTCSRLRKTVILRNPVCRDQIVNSFSLAQTGSAYSIISARQTPFTLSANSDDSITIEFAPNGPGANPARIDIEFDFGGEIKDTALYIIGTGSTNIASNLEDSLLNFDTIITCDNLLKETYVDNEACDSVEILSIATNSNNNFQIIEPSLPAWIAPGERTKIVVKFSSSQSGESDDELKVFLFQNGASALLSLPLNGYAIHEPFQYNISANHISLDTVSPCSSLDTMITIRNPMLCDSLWIDSLFSLGEGSFTASTGKFTVSPGDSVQLKIHFSPRSLNVTISDTIVARIASSIGTKDTSLVFMAVERGALRTLDASEQSINYGTMTFCDSHDSAITLSNNGCDTTTISNIDITGKGFKLIPLSLPIKIPPGSSIQLGIRSNPDTTSATTHDIGIISITSDAILSPTFLSVQNTIVYPQEMTLSPAMQSGLVKPDSIFEVKLKADRINVPGLSSLDFDIDYNSDMLQFTSANATNLITTSDGKHFHISGIPVIALGADSSIANLKFNVFLTADTISSFNLVDIHPNITDPNYELCALQVSSLPMTLRYIYSCGEVKLQTILQRQPLAIDIVSLAPIPTNDALNVSIYSYLPCAAFFKIINVSGETITENWCQLQAGSNMVNIPTKDLPSGAYILSVSNGSTEVAKNFVKNK